MGLIRRRLLVAGPAAVGQILKQLACFALGKAVVSLAGALLHHAVDRLDR